MSGSESRLVSFQEFVKDWAVRNGSVGKCYAAPANTIDHKIVVGAAGVPDWLEFPGGSDPVSKSDREKIAAWLSTRVIRD